MSKALQKFKPSDLKSGRKLSPTDTVRFLEEFTALAHGTETKGKMISIRIPGNVLDAFKVKARTRGFRYQRKIVLLMIEWLNAKA